MTLNEVIQLNKNSRIKTLIIGHILTKHQLGKFAANDALKKHLQEVYNKLGINTKAKAGDIRNFFGTFVHYGRYEKGYVLINAN